MNSHNTKPTPGFHKTPVVTDSTREEAEVISSSLINDSELTIADDYEAGCDPYNSTGPHVIVKTKKSIDR